MKTISIIDYGMSNLLSICRAFEHVGAQVKVIEKSSDIKQADFLVLPGVGAFPDGMMELNKRELSESITAFAQTGKPLIGICLGMQMLLSKGFEHVETDGLDIIPGEVLPLPLNMPNFKIPNINWHSIQEPKSEVWENRILQTTSNNTHFYFVHSYYAKPKNREHILASSRFGELNFAAAVQLNNVCGTQFHPEKSGEAGLELLRCFLKL